MRRIDMRFRWPALRNTVLFAGIALGLWVLLSPGKARAQEESNPKYDIFVGYQWLHPGGNAPNPNSTPQNPIANVIPDMAKGGGAAGTYNFTPHWGLEGDIGFSSAGNSTSETTVSAGPRVILRTEDGAFFFHALLSYNRLAVDRLNTSNGVGGIIGGGMDLKFTKILSWRVFEADFVPAQHHFPQFVPADISRPALHGVRLRTGIVFNLGYGAVTPVSASVSVQPAEAMVGEPLTATATPSNFNPKHELTYEWSSTCGKISGTGATASIDTHGASGGNCTATVKITDAKAKHNNSANASANFTVKEPPKNPPTISCSSSPTSVPAGATVTVSCTCTSPDNVPVTVSNYTANAGTISGAGNTATLNTSGAAPGTITVNASCSDQRGLNTAASTSVTIETPPPPPVNPEVQKLEQRLSLHSIYFPTAQPTPANPKGGLVKSQQQTLIDLAADFKKYLETKPDAHLILEGHADPRGPAEYNQKLSERRTEATKAFLVAQGVPEANIDTKAFGAQQNLTADQVNQSLDQATDITPGEKARIKRNMRTIILASNRRVDVTLSTTGQSSVRQFPFNAADALTLIGGREKPAGTAPAKTKKKPIQKK
jgi:outer membrane protein OmpA-like peptidoglycan-associated protein